jgi:hypothetical protein
MPPLTPQHCRGHWRRLSCTTLTSVCLSPPQEEAVKFSASAGIKSVCLFGGASKGPQIRDLRFGADLCICTPGRLLDLASMVCRFENSQIMTLDKVCGEGCMWVRTGTMTRDPG